MTNKEVIDKLQAFYLTQDPEKVARICANFAVDLNRFLHVDDLDDDEKEDFLGRIAFNVGEIYKFSRGEDLDIRHWKDEDEDSEE